MSSKIEKELCEVTELSPKRGEDRQDFLKRLVGAANELPDEDFNALSEEADQWINSAFDALESKPVKDIPEFPDAEKAEDTGGRRRRGAADDTKEEPATKGRASKSKAPAEPKKGDFVKIVTKRGKEVEGEVLEIDADVLVLGYGKDGDEEFTRSRLESIEVLEGADDEAADDAGEPELKVGLEVELTTKRGKVVKGKIEEIDGDVLVVGGEEYPQSRLETVKVLGGAKKEEAPASGRRRGSAAADEGEAKGGKEKATRATNKDKEVSLGIRIRQMCVEGYKEDGKLPTTEELKKLLVKEGYEVKDNTLTLNYAETKKLFDIMVEFKLLK